MTHIDNYEQMSKQSRQHITTMKLQDTECEDEN